MEMSLNAIADESTVVYVMPKDKVPLGYMSDTEDVTPGRDDAEQNPTSNSSSSSPQRASVSQTLIAPNHSTEQSPTTQMSSDAFVGDVAVRSTQYPQPVLGTEMTAERQSYVEAPTLSSQPTLHSATNLGLHHEMYTSPHETSRRSSMFTSPSEYASPATPTMYSTQWQTGSAAPSNPSVYTFPQQTSSAHQSFVGHTGVAIPQTQSYLGTSFDDMPRAGHGAPHGGMLRPLQSNYSGYMSHDPGHLSAAATKSEPLTRHSTQ